MTGTSFSVILLPTLHCDARCDYCFEDTTSGSMSLDSFSLLLEKLFDFMDERDIKTLNLYWQGGEVFTLSPAWFHEAGERMHAITEKRGRQLGNFLQTNLLGYGPQWTPIIDQIFGNSLGTSMDFPNLHRRMAGGSPQAYTARWIEHVHQALAAGIGIGVIAVPSEESLDLGAEAFYRFFTEEVGVSSFQVNAPFPGGAANTTKNALPLDASRLGNFLVDLCEIWIERGYEQGVKLGPAQEALGYYLHGNTPIPCFWQDNCANSFICIDPQGNISQCDCWVASYPEMRFGNLFDDQSLSTLLKESQARRRFLARPATVVAEKDCLDCDHLALCHGGCPVRAYSTYASLTKKDPYCETYKILFRHLEKIATKLATSDSSSSTHTPAQGL